MDHASYEKYKRSSSEINMRSSPYREQRDFDSDEGRLLMGLLDNLWYPPYIADCLHYHNCMEIGICISGKGLIQLGQQTWDVVEGTVVAAGKGLRHMQQNEGASITQWKYVLIDEDIALQTASPRYKAALQEMITVAQQQGLYFPPDDDFQELRYLLMAMFSMNRHRWSIVNTELETLASLLMMAMTWASYGHLTDTWEQNSEKKMIEPALQFVSEHYAQEIRMSQMAACCAVSESYFRKVFSGIMGMSPLEYLNRYRINRSMVPLRTTNETILQIAFDTGFSSVATYSRNFRRFIGKSPADWRKRVRHNSE